MTSHPTAPTATLYIWPIAGVCPCQAPGLVHWCSRYINTQSVRHYVGTWSPSSLKHALAFFILFSSHLAKTRSLAGEDGAPDRPGPDRHPGESSAPAQQPGLKMRPAESEQHRETRPAHPPGAEAGEALPDHRESLEGMQICNPRMGLRTGRLHASPHCYLSRGGQENLKGTASLPPAPNTLTLPPSLPPSCSRWLRTASYT